MAGVTAAMRILVLCMPILFFGTRVQADERQIFFDPKHIALNSTVDSDSIGNQSVYADATFAPFGNTYESGFRFRTAGSANSYRFLASENPRIVDDGHYFEGAFLVGYAFLGPQFGINFLAGPAFSQTVNPSTTTDRWGAKGVIEMYARPTDLTMASGSVAYSTMANSLQLQAKAGLKIFEGIYFGPEGKFTLQDTLPWQLNFFGSNAVVTSTNSSSQTKIQTIRVGAHVSTLSIGAAFISLSGGWTQNQQLGSGYYGSASVYLPF